MKMIKLTLTILFALLIASNAKAQCPPFPPGCGTWGLENKTPCDLDFAWETPPPCIVTQGAGTLPANSPIVSWPAPCIQAGDCGPECPWALRLLDPPNPDYVIYGNGVANVYYTTKWCADCNGGAGSYLKVTYIPMPGSIPNHVLKIECQ